MDGRMDEWMDGRMDGWMNGWADGWMITEPTGLEKTYDTESNTISTRPCH